jgi:low affinity Fe/Cu permease
MTPTTSGVRRDHSPPGARRAGDDRVTPAGPVVDDTSSRAGTQSVVPAPVVAEDAQIVHAHGPVLRTTEALTGSLGSPWAVTGLAIGAAIWLGAGIATGYSRAWELVATVGLPILALLALFVVQHTQNHNDRALHLKLDELLRALETADGRLVAVEDVDERDLLELRATYRRDFHSSTDEVARRPAAGFRDASNG